MATKKQNRSKKGRKIGRDKAKCERYRAQGRRLINKRRRVARHVRTHPNDLAAANFLGKM